MPASKKRSEHTIIFTTDECTIRGVTYSGIPIIIQRDGTIVEAASDWLRNLAVRGGHPATTLKTYAEVLRLFWNYLHAWNRERRRLARWKNMKPLLDQSWSNIDDDILEEWRNDQNATGVHKKTINYRLRVIFRFYWWAQTTGRVKDLIGWTEWDEHGRHAPLPIRAKVLASGGAGKDSPIVLTSDLLYRNPGKAKKSHVPTEVETYEIHAHLGDNSRPDLAVRNTLMASWAEEAGLRRMEFRAMLVSQIPSRAKISALFDKDQEFLLDLLTTKGDKLRTIPVTPELLERTLDYIEYERQDLVERVHARLRHRGQKYTPPPEIFLSDRGGVLSNQSISNLFSKAFAEVGNDGSLHRFRAKFLTDLAAEYFRIEYERNGAFFSRETILLKLAEIAGHSNMNSLRHYVDLVTRRHFDTDGTQREVTRVSRERSRTRQLQFRLREMLNGSELHEALLVAVGDKEAKQVLEILKAHLQQLVASPM